MIDEEEKKGGTTYNQLAWIVNYQPKIEHQHIHVNIPDEKTADDVQSKEEPLRNIIFNLRLFNSNVRLAKLRDTIAAAIDMGAYNYTFSQPQDVRINPAVQNEWYYILKALEETKISRPKISVTEFIEQMMDWYPTLFPNGTKEEKDKFKRRLSKSISVEKSLWRQGPLNEVVSLSEMWAKGIDVKMTNDKSRRIFAIAYKGLFRNLERLKVEIECENTK